MKEIKKLATSAPNDKYQIPSRDEFHRYYGGRIYNGDFCTEAPTGHMVENIAHSISWTLSNARNTYSNI